jgi:hypothetical protein
MDSMFKRCTLCGKEWGTREEFLNDATLHFAGHQRNRKRIPVGHWVGGLLIYTHAVDDCGTTLAVESGRIRGRRGDLSTTTGRNHAIR